MNEDGASQPKGGKGEEMKQEKRKEAKKRGAEKSMSAIPGAWKGREKLSLIPPSVPPSNARGYEAPPFRQGGLSGRRGRRPLQ